MTESEVRYYLADEVDARIADRESRELSELRAMRERFEKAAERNVELESEIAELLAVVDRLASMPVMWADRGDLVLLRDAAIAVRQARKGEE